MSLFTRDQIISDACQSGGNPNLGKTSAGVVTGSLADFALNYILDHFYRAGDWRFLRKMTTVQTDAADFSKISAASLPSDYRAIKGLRAPLTTDWMTQIKLSELWLKRKNDSDNSIAAQTGKPTIYAIDDGGIVPPDERPDIYMYPKVDTRYTYDIYYVRQPAKLTANTAPEFPDHYALMMGLSIWVRDFQRDSMLVQAKSVADMLIAQFRVNHLDEGRASPLTLDFDRTTFPDYTFD